MHITVAGVHMKGNKDSASQHAIVNRYDLTSHRFKGIACVDVIELPENLFLPRDPQIVVLDQIQKR